MRAIAVLGPDQLGIVDIPMPDAGHRALVEVETAGLCGTDVKILRGAIRVAYPRVLGHEVIGRVVRAAEGGQVAAGTRVLVNPNVWCGRCRDCRADREHICPQGALLGRDIDGGLTGTIAVRDDQLHPVPDDLDERSASLLQVLGTCVHAQTRVDVFPGDVAAVLGLGVSGLLHVQLLRARGVDRVLGVTRSATKRDLALELGATAAVHPDDAPTVMAELSDGAGADLVVESAGSPAALLQAVELAGLGGTVLVFGISDVLDGLPMYDLYYKELVLTNARAARPRDYSAAVALAASGQLRLAPLWSASYPLDRAADAFTALEGSGALKVTLEVT